MFYLALFSRTFVRFDKLSFSTPMQNARFLIVFLALFCVCVCSYSIYIIELERKEVKDDLVELSKIKYGLFNVDKWKDVIAEVLAKKIEDLDFTPEQQVDAQREVSAFLYKAINDMEDRFHEEQSQSVGGMVKIGVVNLTDMFGEIKKNVPEYTSEILSFLSAPDNRDKVKAYIIEKLSEYTDATFSKVDYSAREQILLKYNMADHELAVEALEKSVSELDIKLKKYLYAALFIGFLCAIGLLIASQLSRWEFAMYTLISFGLLGAGLILPMIEIDARIAAMNFSLLGEPVSFSDQILYYKSKSILEVVTTMLSQGKPDVLFVGLLVLLFSVIFPVAKLITSLIYLFVPATGKNRVVRFMVFRTGKWSMADVMVIAIFMAYIGFSGILTEQLGQLEGLSANMEVLTTNRSSLQDGFFMFTAFVILSLLLAHRMEFNEEPKPTEVSVAPESSDLKEEE